MQQLIFACIYKQICTIKNDVKKIILSLEEEIKNISLILLSDYKKGFLTYEIIQYIISMANIHGIPVLVDVKDPNYKKYENATILKPNRKELQILSQKAVNTLEEIIEAAEWLCKEVNCKYVLTTLGSEGMVLVDKEGLVSKISSVAKEIYDVTGAGDTTIAYLAVELTKGKNVCEAMKVANYAAGIQVSKLGTSVVHPSEIENVMQKKDGFDKWINVYVQEDLQKIRVLEQKNKTIVFTNGCFDILHAGHVNYLRKAKNKGDILVVGINSDASVRRLKGNDRPINNLSDRCAILEALEFVDFVIPFEEDTPLELIKKVRPQILVKGGDYRVENIVGAEFVKEIGGIVDVIPFVNGKSTTNIIAKIKD